MAIHSVSKHRAPWTFPLSLLVIVLLGCTAAAGSGAAAAAAEKTGDLGDGAITYEAADLSEAHAPGLEEEMRSMESLLHWAICKSAATVCMWEGGRQQAASITHCMTRVDMPPASLVDVKCPEGSTGLKRHPASPHIMSP